MTDTTETTTTRTPPSVVNERRIPPRDELRQIYHNGEAGPDGDRVYPTMDELAGRYGVSRQRIQQEVGGVRRGDRTGSHHLRTNPAAIDRVKDIAKQYGFILRSGSKAGQGSINGLFEAIAAGEYDVVPSKNQQPPPTPAPAG